MFLIINKIYFCLFRTHARLVIAKDFLEAFFEAIQEFLYLHQRGSRVLIQCYLHSHQDLRQIHQDTQEAFSKRFQEGNSFLNTSLNYQCVVPTHCSGGHLFLGFCVLLAEYV